jgi:serine/threonine protein kinase
MVEMDSKRLIAKFTEKKEATYTMLLSDYPHMIKCYDAVVCKGNRVMILLELAYCDLRTIKSCISKHKLSDKKYIIDNIIVDLLNGLSTIRKLNLMHADIIPDNIFLTDHGAVFADFGVTKSVDEVTNQDSDSEEEEYTPKDDVMMLCNTLNIVCEQIGCKSLYIDLIKDLRRDPDNFDDILDNF